MKNFKSQDEFINQIKEISGSRRSPMSGHSFDIRGEEGKYRVETGRLIGKTDSCLIYQAHVENTGRQNMLMKEFFPSLREDVVGVRDAENPEIIHYQTKSDEGQRSLEKSRKNFVNSYHKHLEIMDFKLKDKIARPYKIEVGKGYILAFYESGDFKALDKGTRLDFPSIVSILRQTSDIVALLHQKDIIYMDLRPANILYNCKRDKVKLFDFEAAVLLDNIDNIGEFYIPKERPFIPPEFRYISNIEKRKEVFISEEIDLYMLGVTLFFLLMDRYPESLENENSKYLEKNLRETLAKDEKYILLKEETTDKLVDLLVKCLSVHRYLSVTDFRDRLTDIEKVEEIA